MLRLLLVVYVVPGPVLPVDELDEQLDQTLARPLVCVALTPPASGHLPDDRMTAHRLAVNALRRERLVAGPR